MQQTILLVVLSVMVHAVSLDLKLDDFKYSTSLPR
jgi:hypothetical protein